LKGNQGLDPAGDLRACNVCDLLCVKLFTVRFPRTLFKETRSTLHFFGVECKQGPHFDLRCQLVAHLEAQAFSRRTHFFS